MLEMRFSVSYPDFVLDIDLSLPGSGVTAIFGHSGSGKTTLLRCIAGLEKLSESYLKVNGETWQDNGFYLPTHKRALGYVFQESSLFQHLTVLGNLNYSHKRSQSAADASAVHRAVSLLGIEELLNRRPNRLSGGERQRVAIARTLLTDPRLLLMDEPLAALDHARKKEIIPYLKQIRSELNIPIIYVSHSPDEIAHLADHIIAMESGRVLAKGEVTEMFSRLDFPLQLGEDAGVVLDVEVTLKEPQWNMEKVCFDGGELWLRDSGHAVGSKQRVRILARDISLARQQHSDTSIQNILPGSVVDIIEDFQKGVALVQIKVGSAVLIARITLKSVDRLQLGKGEKIWAQIKSVALLK